MDFETSWSSGSSIEVHEMSTAFIESCRVSFVRLISFNSMH